MAYGTSLVTTAAHVARLTGVQDLANLEADAELSLATFLLEAHRYVYRALEAAGIDPTLLSNETRLESAVAYEALRRLAEGGYLGAGDRGAAVDRYERAVKRELDAYRPELSSGDEPRAASEAVPVVANFESGWVFGPVLPVARPSRQRWSGDLSPPW